MAKTVDLGSLDALVGVVFGPNAMVNATASLINGSITNSSASTSEVLTYGGLTGTIGSDFIAVKGITFVVNSVNDTDNTLTMNAYVGSTLVAELDFSVAGFSGAGIVLAAMPLASLVTQANNLSGLAGSLFVLGLGAEGAKGQSLNFGISNDYSFFPHASVHYATAANPVLQGSTGAQMLIALTGNDTVTAGPGETIIYGGTGTDVLRAGAGADTIYGGSGTDTIIGGSGADTLEAGSGIDTIYAGTGRSVLIGGLGTDTFVFAPGHTGGLTTATADVIRHFHPHLGDVINLTAFDALLPPGGTGHLSFIGTAAFDGRAGEVRYDVTSSGVTVECDMTGAGTADMMFMIRSVTTLAAGDFVL
ncbi:calcium-binding protein [Novosphingobium sp. FSW06-99]|uniref:calcium-binding protein n=1 Tax=Novosphingobium sp. FSW06-99 TaxID=1739113 RepID=UPI00076C2DE0|nr:hypothetical protein [Novosphingobium sp. FSW06-99]KUR73313.1 hypothetical protein AQZ49_20450 [Novosphingobium sp. FSW06-99]